MRRALLLAATLFASVLLPSVAATSFASDQLVLAGDVAIDAERPNLFVPEGDGRLTWEAVASSVTIHRRYSNLTKVEPAISLAGDDPQRTTVETTHEFGAARLTSTATRPLAALLAAGQDASTLLSHSSGFLDAAPSRDPVLQQDPVVLQAGTEGSVHYGVKAQLEGEFVNLTAGEGTYELRGTLVLQVFDIDYLLTDSTGTTPWQTGEYDVYNAGPVTRARTEIHTLVLEDAVLLVHSDAPAQVYAPNPHVAIEGTVRVQGVNGTPALDGIAFTPTNNGAAEWRGTTGFTLHAQGDALIVGGADDASNAQGRGVLRAADSPLGALIAGVLVALALGVAAFVAHRRRARHAPSLEAALLAMEERRWNDALTHLDRLIALTPTDPILLVDRAICCEETGRLEDARASYEAALVEAPGNAEAHYYYARILARLRMSTACLAHLQRALALDERLAELARKEQAFRSFRDHPQFLHLLGG